MHHVEKWLLEIKWNECNGHFSFFYGLWVCVYPSVSWRLERIQPVFDSDFFTVTIWTIIYLTWGVSYFLSSLPPPALFFIEILTDILKAKQIVLASSYIKSHSCCLPVAYQSAHQQETSLNRESQVKSVLFKLRQITTEVMSGHFSPRADVDCTL